MSSFVILGYHSLSLATTHLMGDNREFDVLRNVLRCSSFLDIFDHRENIPPVMQDECDEIYPAVLVNSFQGSRTRKRLEDVNTPFVAIMYGPPRQNNNGAYTAKLTSIIT